MLDEKDIQAHKQRGLSPERPVVRGTAQNPDVFFQNREGANKYYNQLPGILKSMFSRFGELTGRKYNLFDYFGDPKAEKVIIIMGSGSQTVVETIEHLNKEGHKLGVVVVKVFQPFSVGDFIASLPQTVKKISVLDRCKEPGAVGEPLYEHISAALMSGYGLGHFYMNGAPAINGGRYALSSKEFTPSMVKAIFDEMSSPVQKAHFTIGIKDDVTHLSIPWDKEFMLEDQYEFRGLFYGLGADGTVSANKNAIKIIGENTPKHVQGYFVYDSKKSGSLTVSHLRFGNHSVRSPYLIQSANFVACHQFNFLGKFDILSTVEEGARFLINSPFPAELTWDQIPAEVQTEIISKKLELYVMNAYQIARECGLGSRINNVLLTGFFKIANIIPIELAVEQIKKSIEDTYGHKGAEVTAKNFMAVEKALQQLHKLDYPQEITGRTNSKFHLNGETPEFVREVLGKIIAGRGEDLPVSALPADGTFPTGTTKYEKRSIALEIPVWDEVLCTQCNKCLVVCPHAAIRAKVFDKALLETVPATLKNAVPVGKEFNREQEVYTLQVSPDDCTGCRLCVEACPVESKTEPGHKAINMTDIDQVRTIENNHWDHFIEIPDLERHRANRNTVKGTQFLQPLFEFSGACTGCGETPYLKLISQLFGDRMVIANATGCSSIYGGNLPTTPWTTNKDGRGPAWANSLFEDNAEFGLGIHVANKFRKGAAFNMLEKLKNVISQELVERITTTDQSTEAGIEKQRQNVAELKEILATIKIPEAKLFLDMADNLVNRSTWIVGGDGWAYDIGFGGLDHVISSGENVNIIVLDTEVYSNTGGQTSKSTPRGATAKFSISGKNVSKKDLAFMAMSYGNTYVAQIAMGASDMQTVRAINEAEAFDGPSLIIAYSPCIAHGFEMSQSLMQQKRAVESGYWPLFRYNPNQPEGKRLTIDSKTPTISLEDYIYRETRYSSIKRDNPEHAQMLLEQAKEDVKLKWKRLELLKVM
jgi:pyruvate-ferredoxin/flavodoxin oxidoreductase